MSVSSLNSFAFNQLFFCLEIRGHDFTPCADSQEWRNRQNLPGNCPKLEAVRSGLKDFITQSAPFCLGYQLHLGNEILIFSLLYELLEPLAGEQFRLVLTPSTGAGATRGTLGNWYILLGSKIELASEYCTDLGGYIHAPEQESASEILLDAKDFRL